MKAIIAFLMAIGQFIMSFFTAFNSPAPSEDKTSFVPVIRFEVFSDSHIETFGDKNCHRLQKAINLAYADADSDGSYGVLDAVIMDGDITNGGRIYQFMAVKETLDTVMRDGTKLMGVVHSSHDCNVHGRDGRNLAAEYLGIENDFHQAINGYHFIGVSCCEDDGATYSPEQHEWLEQQIAQAVADDPSKPVFVFHHDHVRDTVYGSSKVDGWGQDYFTDIYEKYPQIVHFSGHSHYPLNDPRSIWQGEFTAVGTGSLYYAEHTVDGENCIHPEDNDKMAQCWIVEADSENRVRLRGFDALSGEVLVEYVLDNLTDASDRQFTPAQRIAASSAPEFETAKIKKAVKTGDKYKVTIPAAKSTDGSIVFIYRATVYNMAGQELSSEYIVNNYQIADCYDEITFTLGLPAGSHVEFVAENAYGMRSEPIIYNAFEGTVR